MMCKFNAEYEYAKRNGYTGTYAEYEALQYEGYCRRMARMEIIPLTENDWIENQ